MGVEMIFTSAPRQFEWFNFQGNATKSDGKKAENVKHLEFSVPTGFGPQNLIQSELRNERKKRSSSPHHGGSNGSIFRVKRQEQMELQLNE